MEKYLQSIKEINIDVSKRSYIEIHVKQYDRNTRYILVTCYDQGVFKPINKTSHFAYIRYRKEENPDNNIFNSCEITEDGKIVVELTEQMLSVEGRCWADLVIHENKNLRVNVIEKENGTVEIINLGDSGILSTMTFYVYVHESAIDNKEVESSYEYNALNDLLIEARRNYWNVATKCYEYKDAAEDAKDAAEIAQGKSETAQGKAEEAQGKAETAQKASENARDASIIAQGKAEEAQGKAETAQKTSEDARDDAVIAQGKAETAQKAAETAKGEAEGARDIASTKATEASNSASAALTSETNANNYYMLSRSYAVGDTTKRTNEAIDNAKYYYEQSKMIASGLNGALLPMGTITFEQLSTMTKEIGYMYNISNEFVSTSEFKDGGNYTYTAGTNVYYTADGFWDCLAGTNSIAATVDEVKQELGI